ncbi:S9 family peptidase [Frigoribacterium sp. PhB24]|uniref:alpha/beta hydrolase family protein n=1 Tax=Frigoribacterium sp. PhB24 TaxID=2485204 RepID=UPI000F96225D|nr:alpha/beta fold hydrolase [Frigoribacterium sp. PhB24]ROS54441.1 alpha-beta hydrolase superfamily lysophospholipase [Frigoribacterium sp. PhB24]
MTRPASTRRGGVGPLAVVSISVGGTVLVCTAAIVSGIVAIARKIVTPARGRRDDVRIESYDAPAGTITLSSTPDTRLPGRYSFWFGRGTGHARVGGVVRDDGRHVERRVEAVEGADLTKAHRGRIGGWLFPTPGDAGLVADEVVVPTDVGPAPAWLVPADAGLVGPWMIGVHGRGVTRAETIRAAPVFHREGLTSLLVSYRNDGEAPRSSDGRYALGDSEWRDVESAIRYALDHGATSVVLMGWSMGGALVLQAATRSALRGAVSGLVLESPVVDWRTTLAYQGAAMRVPTVVQGLVLRLLGSPRLCRVAGIAERIDFDRLDLVSRAGDLDVPVLLLHSDDDGFVPSTASHALAEARPDLVTFEVFDVARHTKLWNLDPERFEDAVADWLDRQRLAGPPSTDQRA